MVDCVTEKPIKGFPDYFIHSDGYVISRKFGKERRMVGNMHGCNNRYVKVTLMQNGTQFGRAIHRLVAEHFLNAVDGKNEVNHKDGDKLNNKAENLEWVSAKENMQHSVKNGLWTSPTDEHYKVLHKKAGQRVALFTMEEASDLMEMKSALNLSSRKLASIVGCSKATIQRLQNNSTVHFTNGSVV